MTNLHRTNLSRGHGKTGSCPASPTSLCLTPAEQVSLPASPSSTSKQNPELQAELTFPKLFPIDQGPKAQHGPLPGLSSQAEKQRFPLQVLQNHSMMEKRWVGEWGSPREEPQSQPQEPTPQTDPFLPQEAVRESSSCRVVGESNNWKKVGKGKGGHEQVNKNQQTNTSEWTTREAYSYKEAVFGYRKESSVEMPSNTDAPGNDASGRGLSQRPHV